MPHRLLKRALGATVLLLLTLTGCGSTADDASRDKAWSHVSGSGKTIKTDQTPKRIIAQADAAAALMAYGIKPVGIFGNEKPEDNKNLEGMDLDGIEVLGTTWGEIDVEKAATLKPDLIVSDYWPAEKTYGGIESGVKKESRKIAELAPFIGGAQGESIVTLLEFYEGLAKSLGADVDSSDGARDKAAFDAAVEEFKAATKNKNGLTAAAVSPAADLLYVAVPEHAPELLDFKRWGLDVLTPRDPDKKFPYWENLSWENADKYQPDVLLVDDRALANAQKVVKKQPSWKSIKAAKADAIIAWPAYWVHTYARYAEQLERMAGEIRKADPDLT